MDLILGHKIDLVIDTPTEGHGDKTRDGFPIRRKCHRDRRLLHHRNGYRKCSPGTRSRERADKVTPVDIAQIDRRWNRAERLSALLS